MTKAKNTYKLENFHLTPNRKIGSWKLAKKLGQGGNGEVWTCRNDKKELYAIKFLKWGSGPAYKRFSDEVSFMENNNDNISGVMPVIDKHLPEYRKRNEKNDLPFYFVMPLAEPIESILKWADIDEKITIIKELLAMLTSLHEHQIAHRDIKPSNVLRYNGKFVLADFGLVFFNKKTAKTPKGAKVGPKWTISPQMERDALSADKYKADVYSMAKTIWMVLTGDTKAFEGQYLLNSTMSLRKWMKEDFYFYPLEKLLSRCTDNDEKSRPDASEMERLFNEWIAIGKSWSQCNLMQWQEVQERLFPTTVPTHAEWCNISDIITVLRLLGQYKSQNHTFFPNEGGLDLEGAGMSSEEGFIEVTFEGSVYILKPKRLSYEFVNNEIEWSYFSLETERIEAKAEPSPDGYFEELIEVANANQEKAYPRQITRWLHGSFVLFHKDSIYNKEIADYRGEHEKMGLQAFHDYIIQQADNHKEKD